MPQLLGLFLFALLLVHNSVIGNAAPVVTKRLWVDSIFDAMSQKEKIGQLFMVSAYSNKDEGHQKEIETLIKNYKIGGLIFMQGGPVRQAHLTNRYQSYSKIPLLISTDAEWGLAMRLDSTITYPKQMLLGAIEDNELIYKMGSQIAEQCRRIGVHVNFAPVVDVNVNPKNPVIGPRSFGENKKEVAEKGYHYMKGLQDNGVMATAKHFPGHGDTDKDSHHTLPIITHDKKRLEEIEFYPFTYLIDRGLQGAMVAHLYVPSLDKRKNKPTTLSEKVVTDLLQEDLGFEGLIFTDALNMKGITSHYQPGEADLLAFEAGNDILLFPEDVPKAVDLFMKALKEKKISEKELDRRVKKILASKYDLGLNTLEPIDLNELNKDLHHPSYRALVESLHEEAITLLENEQEVIPIGDIKGKRFVSIAVGPEGENEFQRYLSKYAPFAHHQINNSNGATAHQDILSSLDPGSYVVLSFHDPYLKGVHSGGLSSATQQFLKSLDKEHHLILVYPGNPYDAKHFVDQKALMLTYTDNNYSQKAAAQAIFGAIGAKGKLPISTGIYPEGTSLKTKSNGRLGFAHPLNGGIDPERLKKIDTIMDWAINDFKATPGAQILIARKGKILFQKNYGKLSWFQEDSVNDQTLYDIASVTKVAATLQAAQYLYDRGLLELDSTIDTYLPEFRGTDKCNITVKDLLLHQAGLKPFIPFWRYTMGSDSDKAYYYCSDPNSWYCRNVGGMFYTIDAIEDTLWQWTLRSGREKFDESLGSYPYKYSDLSFFIVKTMVERILDESIEEWLEREIYDPLHMTTTQFNPNDNVSACTIAPTEDDQLFRKTMLRGWVHDEFAALLGGVGGHAGLFANAEDMAVLLQMHLNGGEYGGRYYFSEATIDTFTSRHRDPHNRRGLGWDKPFMEGGGIVSEYASPATYGHRGFTGTAVWADPKEDLIFIFLSNRIHPERNNKLSQAKIRRKVQDIAYKAIMPEEFPLASQSKKN